MADTTKVPGEVRTDFGKGYARRIRQADKIPADYEVAGEMGLMKTSQWALGDAKHFEMVQKGSQLAGKVMRGKKLGPIPVPVAERWLKYRDVDEIPSQSFRNWWKKNREEH